MSPSDMSGGPDPVHRHAPGRYRPQRPASMPIRQIEPSPGAAADLHPGKRPPAGLPGPEPWSVGYRQHPQ